MSSRYVDHPVSDEKWYEEKCQDFLDGKCDSYGHSVSSDKSDDKSESSDSKSEGKD